MTTPAFATHRLSRPLETARAWLARAVVYNGCT